MEIKVRINNHHLWPNQTFEKNSWSPVNYLIGPNGTGKSSFGEELRSYARDANLKVRYLSSERLSGMERQSYSNFTSLQIPNGLPAGNEENIAQSAADSGLSADAFYRLRDKPDIKIKVEKALSKYFGRSLTLVNRNGYLVPELRSNNSSTSYDFRSYECHGLKELITVLTFLYDDDYNCLIIDEPELHLHPQLQSFFLRQIRSVCGNPFENPLKKCFFLITHSPNLIDLRTIDDLQSLLIFQHNQKPTFLAGTSLSSDDEKKLSRLIPRLNSHHKQFLFSKCTLFVEGPTDEELITLIQERRNVDLHSIVDTVIWTGGKEELDTTVRLARLLKRDCRALLDLDGLLEGKLRVTTGNDERCRLALTAAGLDKELMNECSKLASKLDVCISSIESTEQLQPSADCKILREQLDKYKDVPVKRRYAMLLAVRHFHQELAKDCANLKNNFQEILELLDKIISACEQADLFILPNGELENYLPSVAGPLQMGDKQKLVRQEYEKALDLESEFEMTNHFRDLCVVLDRAYGHEVMDFQTDINRLVSRWIFEVQNAVKYKQVREVDELTKTPDLDWVAFGRIVTLISIESTADGFQCSAKLSGIVDPLERTFVFGEKFVPTDFDIRILPIPTQSNACTEISVQSA